VSRDPAPDFCSPGATATAQQPHVCVQLQPGAPHQTPFRVTHDEEGCEVFPHAFVRQINCREQRKNLVKV
jgi:hypothetical protein